jgi:hypothetical protein
VGNVKYAVISFHTEENGQLLSETLSNSYSDIQDAEKYREMLLTLDEYNFKPQMIQVIQYTV